MLRLNYEEIKQRCENGTLFNLLDKAGVDLDSLVWSLLNGVEELENQVLEDEETIGKLNDQIEALECELFELKQDKTGE